MHVGTEVFVTLHWHWPWLLAFAMIGRPTAKNLSIQRRSLVINEVVWISLMLCQDETLENLRRRILQQRLVTLVDLEERGLTTISRCYAVLGLVKLEVE